VFGGFQSFSSVMNITELLFAFLFSDSRFWIDNSTGILTINGIFDYENKHTYSLQIVVSLFQCIRRKANNFISLEYPNGVPNEH
jgi:hypothetical protein